MWPRIALLLIPLTVLGCLGHLDGARQALTSAELLQAQAVQVIKDSDGPAQQAIIEHAKETGDVAQARKDLQAYRNRRQDVLSAVLEASGVASMLAVLIPLVDAGAKKQPDIDSLLARLLTFTQRISETLSVYVENLPK